LKRMAVSITPHDGATKAERRSGGGGGWAWRERAALPTPALKLRMQANSKRASKQAINLRKPH